MVRVRDLADGVTAKVAGIARAEHAPLVAPFSGRKCALFRLVTWRRQHRERLTVTEEMVDCIADEEHGTRFSLDDGTGVAVVEPRGWVSWRVERLLWRGSPGPEVEANLDAWREGKRPEQLGFFQGFHEDFTYVEWAVVHGEPVTVLGRATETRDGEHARTAGYRDAPRGFVLASSDATLVLAPAQRRAKT